MVRLGIRDGFGSGSGFDWVRLEEWDRLDDGCEWCERRVGESSSA